MVRVAEEPDLKSRFHTPVERISVERGGRGGPTASGDESAADASSWPPPTRPLEQDAADPPHRQYSLAQLGGRVMSPSSLLLPGNRWGPGALSHSHPLLRPGSGTPHHGGGCTPPSWPPRAPFYAVRLRSRPNGAPERAFQRVPPDSPAPGLEDSDDGRERSQGVDCSAWMPTWGALRDRSG